MRGGWEAQTGPKGPGEDLVRPSVHRRWWRGEAKGPLLLQGEAAAAGSHYFSTQGCWAATVAGILRLSAGEEVAGSSGRLISCPPRSVEALMCQGRAEGTCAGLAEAARVRSSSWPSLDPDTS